MSPITQTDAPFFAKILLFGEYTLINGSDGLAIPLPRFKGRFNRSPQPDQVETHFQLFDLCHYLKSQEPLFSDIDLNRFEDDIKQGIYFKSDIPQGYGVGSSGALCSAVYARYANHFERKTHYSNDEFTHLKSAMALIEEFYHGSSSGLDCLISLVGQPIRIKEQNKFDVIAPPNLETMGQFYLCDSGITRNAASFITLFVDKYKSDADFKTVVDKLSQLSQNLIANVSDENKTDFKGNLRELSALQYAHFSDMIPPHIKSLWKQGLDTDTHLFKLCGAGGGGFFLVYSDNQAYNRDCSYIDINAAA